MWNAVLALLFSLALAPSATAQVRISVETRAGLPVPVGRFQNAGEDVGDGLHPRDSFSGMGILHVTPMLALYAGASLNRFRLTHPQFSDVGVDDRGAEAGALASYALFRRALPWVRGGVVYREARVVRDFSLPPEPTPPAAEPHLGVEVGGGVELPLGWGISLTPGASFVHYRTDEGFGEEPVSYVRADVGVRIRL
jgi:hypothetical protein